MGNIFKYYTLLARRWMWMLLVGALVCGGATYLASTFLRPVYQASAYVIINVGAPHPSVTESLQAVPTFAQLITIPAVLDPVVEQHPGMSMQELLAMISIKPQTNTQIIELDVQADNPSLAAELANQVSRSFEQYANTAASAPVGLISATTPTLPAQPRPLQAAVIGAVVGLLLTLLLAVLFEWIGNRANSVEQIQELLSMEIMTLVPRFARKGQHSEAQMARSEKYHMICASLNVAQASKSFKLVMYTSALAGEGKSTIISNVAIHLAQSGKRVLLVDLNVHRPVLAQRFHLKCEIGLTNMLARKSKRLPVEQYSQDTSFAGLQVLAAGTQAMNSSEFLRSLATADFFSRLKQAPFDYVLFDTPPLFAVAEAQILASSIEALVLVVNGARTPRRVLARTRQLLWRMQTTRVLGVIVNQSSWRDYADTHPYALPLPRQASEQQFIVEEVTLELPAVTMGLITAPTQVIEQGDLPLPYTGPDTGETEQINSEPSERVIQPPFSLSGLMMPTNGLTGRACSGDIATPVPPSLQNLS